MGESQLIHGKPKELAGVPIARILPTIKRRSVGPFVFLDQMGPLSSAQRLDVRPHPHIGLATLTYLYHGSIFHRDSLSSAQLITPGAINLMVAGRGIVHSERSPEDSAVTDSVMQGLQFWIALPRREEDCEPEFLHYPSASIPVMPTADGVEAKLLMGRWRDLVSPVKTHHPTLLISLTLRAGTRYELETEAQELGVLLAEGEAEVEGKSLHAHDLLVLGDPRRVTITARSDCRVALIGGDPHSESRFIWWNFVSSEKEKIREAASRWEKQSMGKVPGDSEIIPLPGDVLL